MRFRLLRRRLTISAPRMAVRSALPWPLRWLVFAVVLGLCAAVALWAFEFGRSLAGLDAGGREELVQLRSELARLRTDAQQNQTIANTSGSLLLAERSALDQLKLQLRQLEGENRSLREDLGFFEKLIPSSSSDGDLAIRGLQAEQQADATLRWQVLVMRPVKNAAEFSGQLELVESALSRRCASLQTSPVPTARRHCPAAAPCAGQNPHRQNSARGAGSRYANHRRRFAEPLTPFLISHSQL